MPQTPTESGWTYAGEAAQILGVSRDTLISLTDAGEIPCWRPTPTSQRRYDRTVLLEYRAKADAQAGRTPVAEAASA